MSDELEKKDFGQRGIDTKLERDLINYDPSFEYEKPHEAIEDSFLSDSTGYVPSDSLVYAATYTISYANAKIAEARTSVDECSSIIESTLQNKTVILDESDAGKLIKNYIGSNQITFSDFKNACSGTTQADAAVVSYYAEKTAEIEAMLYPDVVNMSNMLEGCDVLVNESSLALLTPDLTIDVDEATDEFISNWEELDEERNALEEADEDVEQKITENESNLSPTLNNLAAGRADAVKSNSDIIKETIQALPTDILGDAINETVANLIDSISSDTIQEWSQLVTEAKKYLKVLRKMLVLQDVMSKAKVVDSLDLTAMVAMPVVRQITDRLLDYIGKLRDQAINPSIEFLKKIQKKCKRKSKTVDDLAHTILDVSENIEDKLKNVILDYYRMTQKVTEETGDKIVQTKKVQWIKTFSKLLDQIEKELDNVSPDDVFNRLNGIDSYAIAANVEKRFTECYKS